MRTIALIAILLASCCTLVRGQFDVDGPNAILTLQGVDPSAADPVAHELFVPVGSQLTTTISSGMFANQAMIVLGSPVPLTGIATVPTPWGGAINVGAPGPNAISIIGDGIGLSTNPFSDPFFVTSATGTFTFSLSVPSPLASQVLAVQAVLMVPNLPPFFFDNTQAGGARFEFGQLFDLFLPADNFISLPPFHGNNAFPFHGVEYTLPHVSSNGYVTFGGGTTLNTFLGSGGFATDPAAWLGLEPSIAVLAADWDVLTAGIRYEERNGQALLRYGNANGVLRPFPHEGGTDANMFSLCLELRDVIGSTTTSNPAAGTFRFDFTTIAPAITAQDGDGFLGHTPGGSFSPGSARDWDLHTSPTAGPNDAQIEEHDCSGNNSLNLLGFDGSGSPNNFYGIRSWHAQTLTFNPNPPISILGDLGYTSVASGTQPDLAKRIDPNPISTAGCAPVTIAGVFFGFDPTGSGAGTVVFDPSGAFGGPYPATVVGILDDTVAAGSLALPNPPPSPVRNGQGLVVVTPPLGPPGVYDCQVTFASGSVVTFPVIATPPGTIVTPYTLADDAAQLHALTVSVDLYGTTYLNLWIGSNGVVTFGAPTTDFTPTLGEFFAGWQGSPTTAPNPGVAVLWTDLNLGGTTSGATYDVVEDTTNSFVSVRFMNQNYWNSNTPAGSFVVTFGGLGSGSFLLDHTALLTGVAGVDPDPIIGVTDGDDTIGLNSIPGAVFPGYTSGSARDSVGHQFALGVDPLPSSLTTWVDLGAGTFTVF